MASQAWRMGLGAMCVVLVAAAASRAADNPTAREILDATGVRGGLVVHVGCGDGKLTAALRANDSYIVHGLATDAGDVAKARKMLLAAGVYGPVSIARMPGGQLPYTDNLVNLVVVSDAGAVDMDEVNRVLCPNGVAYVRQGAKWVKTVKPRPGEIDEWTHYMHSAAGNAVSNDTVVAPPRRLQWVGGPRWSRHHEHMSSFSAMVTTAGRLFYIIDEGSRASIQLPAKWKLIARDAFNGCILWKRDIPLWYTHIYPLKSGPALLPRRLVAVGDRVYATLGLGEPVVALDAATGETVRTYDKTNGAEEILCSDGVLLVVADPRPVQPDHYTWQNPVCWTEKNRVAKARAWDQRKRTILAIEAATGKTIWKTESPIAPMSLAVDARQVVFHDGAKLICLDRTTGKGKWASPPVRMRLPMPNYYAPTLVLHDDVVLFAGGNRKMSGVSAETGKILWTAPHYRAGHSSPEDLLVIDGLAWTGLIAGGSNSGVWTGYDVHTGQVKREFTPDVETYWFHHRCHRSKATVRYLLPSRTGVEFVDWRKEHWIPHHWVRGACLYGIMPANGLLYAPQHPCACYLESKLNGLNALAPASAEPLPKPAEAARLQTGPAYKGLANPLSAIATPQSEDWPTYRHDNARSGFVQTTVGADLKETWQRELGGPLSSVVVADGKCFVSAIDTHTVYALDAATGAEVWRFTADGPVDSPPTIHNGCAIFGSADGYVYCLRASDGELAWRYLAAPADRRTMAFEHLESLWPVHGNVLVHGGVVTCVAGRSAFLNGGMRLCRIDAATGKLVSETALDDRIPGTQDNLQKDVQGLNMPPALPDVMSCDGKYLYMRSQRFDLAGKRTELFVGNPSWNEPIAQKSASEQTGPGTHLFCGTGFLDGLWFHRSYWLYGRMIHNGCNFWFRAARYAPSGRIMVFDDKTVYGYGRLPHYMLWTPALEYRLFATARDVDPESTQRVLRRGLEMSKEKKGRWIFDRDYTSNIPDKELSAADIKWSTVRPPLLARAMALAGKTLFVAGPPDLLDEEAAVARRFDDDVQKQIAEQDAALDGKRAALLWAVSADDGKRLAELKLDAPPVWDGMAAAQGRLYVATTDGKVRCLAGK